MVSLSCRYGECAGAKQSGIMYEEGRGVPKNNIEAYKWFLLSAAQGNEMARRKAECLENHLTPEEIARGQNLASLWKPNHETD